MGAILQDMSFLQVGHTFALPIFRTARPLLLENSKKDVWGRSYRTWRLQKKEHTVIWYHHLLTKINCVLEFFPRCGRLFLMNSVRDIHGCDLTENGDFEEGTCVHMVAKDELKNDLYIN